MDSEDPDTVIRDVGRRVAELRTGLGLTQDKFAEALGVSGVYVRRVEIGQENLTLRSLTRLAAMLGVRAMDLLAVPQSREVRVGRPPRRSKMSPDTTTTDVEERVVPTTTPDPPQTVGESRDTAETTEPGADPSLTPRLDR